MGLAQALDSLATRLDAQLHPVTFMGTPGAGTSSAVAALSGLHLGERPRTRAELKERSVLALGAGRTTAFEVRVRAPTADESPGFALLIEPIAEAEARGIVAQVADQERARWNGETLAAEGADLFADALRRAVLTLADLPERLEQSLDGGQRRRRWVRPIDALQATHGAPGALEKALWERIRLTERDQVRWELGAGPSAKAALKDLFERIQNGEEPRAPLPRRIELVAPDLMRLDQPLFDTCGMAGPIEAREDLFAAVRDPTATLVLCTPLAGAPSAEVRELLTRLQHDAALREALDRVLLLVLDLGQADQVPEAEGDRELGQELIAEKCLATLQQLGLSHALGPEAIVVFDPLQDPPQRLQGALDRLRAAQRTRDEQEARRRLAELTSLAEDPAAAASLEQSVHAALHEALSRLPLVGTPLSDPLEGFKAAYRSTPEHLMVATLRREGKYPRLNLFTAVEAHARAAATAWIAPVVREGHKALQGLGAQPLYAATAARLEDRLRAAQAKIVSDYGERLRKEAETRLHNAPCWREALAEWETGPGFRERSWAHFERWSALQPWQAHLQTTAHQHLPWLAPTASPKELPGFVLKARNLRGLRALSWSVQGLNLLIGANGAGKSTALAALRFLGLCFREGVAAALRGAFGGAGNLRSWDAPADAPIEIRLCQGERVWEFSLWPRAGGSDLAVRERLWEGAQEVFVLEDQRRLRYRSGAPELLTEDVCGLRALSARGLIDPALRALSTLAQGIRAHRVFNLSRLRDQGSNTQDDRELDAAGTNAFTLLRRFKLEASLAPRYRFVEDTLRLAFARQVHELDLPPAAGSIQTLNLIAQPGRSAINIADEAEGVLQCLVNLVAIASARDGDVVALDQPEDGLHPYAQRAFLRRCQQWARAHRITVILATHSTVLLDALREEPEHIFVMKDGPTGERPCALPELYDPDWLNAYQFGDLYARDELGSNVDPVR